MISTVVAILGLGAAYTGRVVRPIGFVAFIALNVLSIALVFAQPLVSAIGVAGVLTILLWHARTMSTPRPPPRGDRPPRGSRKVAKPHFLESAPLPRQN